MVTCDASGIIEYDRRTSELAVSLMHPALHMKADADADRDGEGVKTIEENKVDFYFLRTCGATIADGAEEPAAILVGESSDINSYSILFSNPSLPPLPSNSHKKCV